MANGTVIKLDALGIGKAARVERLLLQGAERRRLLDLGLVPGTIIEGRIRSPLGDPVAYQVRGSVIAIRKRQAEQIEVVECEN